MSRIEGIPANRANPIVRIVYAAVRRTVAKLTGQPKLTPDIPVRAHRTSLLLGHCALEQAAATKPRVDRSLRALVQIKAAVMLGCEMCQDIGSQQALAAGISEAQVRDLYRYSDSEHFGETQKLVLDLAVGMTSTPVNVSDETFDALRERFDEPQLVELVNLICLENLRSRFNRTFDLRSQGFNEGSVCARMETAPPTHLSVVEPAAAGGQR
ncbi:MAG: carboxymuconolactone decarboxylase family protein [Solirubrobacteraceae bacterium]|jgi:4-carboxymuconolactone decarboxylase